jgi:acyl-CoA thioester hydrolase
VKRQADEPPAGSARSRLVHRVPFYETDAMGIVHHANYVRYLELARIRWMDEHHRPYREYVAEGLHFATTHVEVDYHRAVTFDEEVAVTVWLDWVRGASLRMSYRLETDGLLVATAATEHAMVDAEGRVRRIPRERREALAPLAGVRSPDGTSG